MNSRSNRLASPTRTKNTEPSSDQDVEDNESNNADSDEEGGYDILGEGGGGDDNSYSALKESSPAVKSGRVTIRRGVNNRECIQSSETLASSETRAQHFNPKTQSTRCYLSQAEKTRCSSSNVGDDLGEGSNIRVMCRKRMSSASNDSRESKRSQACATGNKILSSSSIFESIDDMAEGRVGSPSQLSNSGRSIDEVGDTSATFFRMVYSDRVGRKTGATLWEGSPQNFDSELGTGGQGKDFSLLSILPTSAGSNDANSSQKVQGFSSTLSISKDVSRDGDWVKANALTKFDTEYYTSGSIQESNMADSTDPIIEWLRDSAGNESAERGNDQIHCSTMKVVDETISARALEARGVEAGANEAATRESLSSRGPGDFLSCEKKMPVSTGAIVGGQSSEGSPTQVDRQGLESYDGALVAGSDDIEERHSGHNGHSLAEPVVPFAPRQHEKEILPWGAESLTYTEGQSDRRICELRYPVDVKVYAEQSNHQGVASVESTNNAPVVDPACGEMINSIVLGEAAVHQPISQTPVEIDCPASSSDKLNPESTVSMLIHYPETSQARETHSVGQLKMALFLEASNVHRGNCAERMFSEYWETIGEYITLGSRKGPARLMSDQRASRTGIESTLRSFLRTRKMKRLHNKLVLAIMSSTKRSDAPARLSVHIPPQWKTKTHGSFPNQLNTAMTIEHKSDLRQWRSNFGPRSVAWTAGGNEIALAKTDSSNDIHPNLVSSIHSGDVAVESVVPSARLPGALQIEPFVRKHTAHSGLTASEDAIWLLVVAVREYAFALIKRIMLNDKDFADSYAPRVPNHFQISLAFPHISSNKIDDSAKNVVKENTTGKRVINSICLSHVLATNPSAASRLASMYSIVLDDRQGSVSHVGLDYANYLINSSIQRAASRRLLNNQKSSSPAHNTNASSSAQSDNRSAKSQLHSSQTPAASPSKTTLPYPARNIEIISGGKSDEISTKSHLVAQLHSSQTPAPSHLKSTVAYLGHKDMISGRKSDECAAKSQEVTQLHPTQTPATSHLKSTVAYPGHLDISSRSKSDENAAKSQLVTQLHSTQIPATSHLKSTVAYPAHATGIISGGKSDESLTKAQLQSNHTFPAGSLLNPVLGYSAASSSEKSNETLTQTQLHSNQMLPAVTFPLNLLHMPQLVPQQMDHHITPQLLQSELILSSTPYQSMPSMFTMQMMNQMVSQNTRLGNFIQNSAPFAKPVFPEIVNTQKKSELPPIVFTKAERPQNLATPMIKLHPTSARLRDSKDLAALLAIPLSQPDAAKTKESISSFEHEVDKITLEKAARDQSDLRQKSPTGTEKDVTTEKQNGVQDVRPPVNTPLRPRGRGFGVKNLAAMRARSSMSDSSRSSFTDSGK
ncbi:hypothetical protein ACHAXA_005840 [Cyclostephanos tholiformis]|uniref:Uncharacterized protein n=1 Tax=Cyclostephanos tholiformis TaxID=382380 RepID=A0ABD3RW88_9STRA